MPNPLGADHQFDFLTLLRHADFGINLMANGAGALLFTEPMMDLLYGQVRTEPPFGAFGARLLAWLSLALSRWRLGALFGALAGRWGGWRRRPSGFGFAAEVLLVEPSHLPGELPDLFRAVSQQYQQLLDEPLGRQGPRFPPLFPLQGPGMHPAIVMGGLAVTHCPHRGQSVRFGPNILAFPQHGPQSSKRPVACPVLNREI
jgi:hypothetical protein